MDMKNDASDAYSHAQSVSTTSKVTCIVGKSCAAPQRSDVSPASSNRYDHPRLKPSSPCLIFGDILGVSRDWPMPCCVRLHMMSYLQLAALPIWTISAKLPATDKKSGRLAAGGCSLFTGLPLCGLRTRYCRNIHYSPLSQRGGGYSSLLASQSQ